MARIASVVGAGVNSFTTAPIDTTGATFLVATVSWASGAATFSDNKGNTWTALPGRAAGVFETLLYAWNPIVGPGHTFSFVADYSSAVVAAYSEIRRSSNPIDVYTGNTGSPPTSTGSITPTTYALVVTGALGGAHGTFATVSAPFTMVQQQPHVNATNYSSSLADCVRNASATIDATWNAAASPICASIAAFAFEQFTSRPTIGVGATASLSIGSDAINLDAVSAAANYVNATSVSWTHTCTGRNRLLLVVVEEFNAGANLITSITYGGLALTKRIDGTNSSGQRTSLYYLINPPVGTAQIVVTASATDYMVGHAQSYTGVDQNVPFNAVNAQSGGGSTVSMTLTTTVNRCWMAGGGKFDTAAVVAGVGTAKVRSQNNNVGSWTFDSDRGLPTGVNTVSVACADSTPTMAVYAALTPVQAFPIGTSSAGLSVSTVANLSANVELMSAVGVAFASAGRISLIAPLLTDAVMSITAMGALTAPGPLKAVSTLTFSAVGQIISVSNWRPYWVDPNTEVGELGPVE